VTGEWDAPTYDRLPAGERSAFVRMVAARMPAPELGYVRLNFVARRAAR
jgi:hypothetical protein